MEANSEQHGYEKFLALEEEKRERILSAAMKEFVAGYKKASTDNIVREAGISKGLLFHYFGTKENLYRYLVEYATDTLKDEFFNIWNVSRSDILDSLWQASLLKHDISLRYPDIFAFMTNVYLDATVRGTPLEEVITGFAERRKKVVAQLYANADLSLFRDDIDPQAAIDIINWAFNGYAEATTAEAGAVYEEALPGTHIMENYGAYLEEFKKYLDIFRKCFYKPNNP